MTMSRLKLLYVFFSLLFLSLLGRLFYWQVIQAGFLANQAKGQYESGRKIDAPRGNILARDGTFLVARGEAWLVFANPKEVKDINSAADYLAPFFVEPEEGADLKKAVFEEAGRVKELMQRDLSWVPLKNKVTEQVKNKIADTGISGIGFEPQETRLYPEASSSAQILGFVGKNEDGENVGYFGLEGYYDLPLSGKPGFSLEEKDAAGSPILIGSSFEISAIGGVDLLTHIDKTVQLIIERELKEGIEKYGAKAGSVVVMDPKTGAILGMSSYPSFDPNEYSEYSDELFRNPIVSDSFEPGSIFKVIVMAGALDAGVVKPDTKCDICDGPLKIDKYFIKTWNEEYHPNSTMEEVIINSDNVGMAFVAGKLGEEALYDYLDKFGIGRKTGIDLQGEIDGQLKGKGTWGPVDLASISFGQAVAVTPVQMVKAVSIIANSGYEVTPQVVDKLVSSDWEEDLKPRVGARILSDSAVHEIKAMMESAAKKGESRWTDLAGFSVAGKTGTAQIPIAGHYDEEKTIASFVGFAPADEPKFVMLVTLREPENSPWASETAAPLWYSVAEDLFPYLGIAPEQ